MSKMDLTEGLKDLKGIDAEDYLYEFLKYSAALKSLVELLCYYSNPDGFLLDQTQALGDLLMIWIQGFDKTIDRLSKDIGCELKKKGGG
jgi:hypothetical protein